MPDVNPRRPFDQGFHGHGDPRQRIAREIGHSPAEDSQIILFEFRFVESAKTVRTTRVTMSMRADHSWNGANMG